jgi:hypothetical protein
MTSSNLIVDEFHAPMNQVIYNKDKDGESHPRGLGYYKEQCPEMDPIY